MARLIKSKLLWKKSLLTCPVPNTLPLDSEYISLEQNLHWLAKKKVMTLFLLKCLASVQYNINDKRYH